MNASCCAPHASFDCPLSGVLRPYRADRERQQRVDLTCSPSRRRMAASCAQRPFVLARQTSLHHRSNQTRNRHGWRCLAERKLRLRIRQYGERYLWFESISLRNWRNFLAFGIMRHFRRLAREISVCARHSAVSGANWRPIRPKVSGRKFSFPGMLIPRIAFAAVAPAKSDTIRPLSLVLGAAEPGTGDFEPTPGLA